MSDGQIIAALAPVIVLLFLGVIAAIGSRIVGVSPIVGYIVLGLILRAVGQSTIVTESALQFFAEMGVAFLLFEIGLHFSLRHIKEQASDIFAFGPLQIAFATVVLGLAAAGFGLLAPVAALTGGTLALSSTAVVGRLIAERHQQSCPVGLTATAILVFQDVAAIVLLIVVETLGTGETVGRAIAIAVAKAGIAFLVVVLMARMVVGSLLNLVATSRSEEVFTAAALLVALAAGWGAGKSGLSFTLGAFLGGVTLAETPFKAVILSEIKPFRGLLLGFFFLYIGMSLDVPTIVHSWATILALTIGLIVVKAMTNIGASLVFRWSVPGSIQLGLLLAQGSEFAFVIWSLPEVRHAIGDSRVSVLIATVVLSMAATPDLAEAGRRLAGRMRLSLRDQANNELVPRTLTAPVLIVVMGRSGRALADALIEFGIDYHAIERDHQSLQQAIADGYEVSFGNPGDTRIWQSISMHDREIVVFTAPDLDVLNQTAHFARSNFPNLKPFAVVKDVERGKSFENLGMKVIVDHGETPGIDVARVILSELGIPDPDIDDWIKRQAERERQEVTKGGVNWPAR
jgi:CPA2 family monovalent cation:H+ antiporter-2